MNYTYKTKCRICDCFFDWHFSTSEQTKWVDFVIAMDNYKSQPRQSNCENCKKQTVQDVVCYTKFN